MNDFNLKHTIEALLLSSDEPLSTEKLFKIISNKHQITKADVLDSINSLENDYLEKEIEVSRVASGYRIQAKKTINDYLNIIFAERTPKYSRALMETLSIIAYKQPVTRGDIEAIRGVSVSSSIMRTLTDRNWIKIIGYRDVPGKPAMFSTTADFLNYFGLEKLEELPDLPDIKEPKNLDLDLDNQSNTLTQKEGPSETVLN
ncbi:MAG: SMC-Scp complex subunit ScpB [Gammaproteobacteria bacterium]|jgi:segregation and condensation protein B|nr:SMC-Scp complex subunit ScpB [Gammaproteobacteria bacterium]MDG2297091.1 SMC-Scp complex subunit ScpB [Gammaproteobacteria bacterium]|tara:strand:- start:307 stop:912 length:606 start_codon:yes stop_codon:yes gene_type:complete